MSVAPPPSARPNGSNAQTPPLPNNAWAFRIATVAGIPIRLHFTFLLFLLWIGLSGPRGSGGLTVGFVVAVFACVVLHELGHSLVALHYGIPVADITLYPIGGIARIEKQPKARQELWIAVAGPAVNVAIAAILWAALMATGMMPPPETMIRFSGAGAGGFLAALMRINITLVLFNMIPAFPMDGGRVLRAALALTMPPERATAIAASIGQGIAVFVGVWAIFSQAWLLMFIAFFVYIGASQEAFSYKQAALVEGVLVKAAMMTDVRTLLVGNTLKEAADVLLDTSQHDFPVLHGDAVQGLLTRDGLLRGLAEQGPGGYVAGAMNRDFVAVGPDDELGEMIPRLQGLPGPLLVLDPANESRLLGIITGENVAEFFAIRRIAAAQAGGRVGH